jgi:hypothetical protein
MIGVPWVSSAPTKWTTRVAVALHSLEPDPDVGLDVLHHVANMESGVGVGQGSGDEQLASHG